MKLIEKELRRQWAKVCLEEADLAESDGLPEMATHCRAVAAEMAKLHGNKGVVTIMIDPSEFAGAKELATFLSTIARRMAPDKDWAVADRIAQRIAVAVQVAQGQEADAPEPDQAMLKESLDDFRATRTEP